ncbi:YdgH/BhsA/McbA-like domain containing protein [Acerihabitans sp. TG2]|uniref:YdgH/BhsA/McbA-like domain containing protein n=1 Tax=Acerihabitans sp. TG2 TaxID=3096008 RepID=UPI002B22C946|nr:YdgH/BhsA/McbA-like domain containing protein [Acerihabitans sp. TG2]MEA9393071.1 YdgH/BhsA/McbA-like domain containing protein [Acerihabitans sp. TG2]
MKITTATSLMTVISALSFGTFADESINQEQANHLHTFDSVSAGGIDGAASSIHPALNQAAEAKGAMSYRVTEAHDNDTWQATAARYK